MGFIPGEAGDFFERALDFAGDNPVRADGFKAATVPGISGIGTRQSQLSNERDAIYRRKMVHWLIPEGPIVEMYINPRQIGYSYSKEITETRTKGGYLIQYWGEALTTLNIQGTTGTSGIEGINVLYDIYRNEQLAFDPYALHMAAVQKESASGLADLFGADSALSGLMGGGGDVVSSLFGMAESAVSSSTQPPPSLAALASTVEMYWSGEVYRGYFKAFTVTESADKLGMFDYTIEFKVTQKRGYRRNFLAWHRSAVSGPSDSDPEFGRPYSFKYLVKSPYA